MSETTEQIQAKREALEKLTEARKKDLEIIKKLDQVAKNRRTALERSIEFHEQQTKLYRTAAKDLTALLEVSKETNSQEEIFNTLKAETIKKVWQKDKSRRIRTIRANKNCDGQWRY